jgi:hypothetical protein
VLLVYHLIIIKARGNYLKGDDKGKPLQKPLLGYSEPCELNRQKERKGNSMTIKNAETGEQVDVSVSSIVNALDTIVSLFTLLFGADEEDQPYVQGEVFECLVERTADITNKTPDEVFNVVSQEVKDEETTQD